MPSGINLNDQQKQLILDAYTKGESSKSIANRLNISQATVVNTTNKAGLTRRFVNLTLEQRKAAVAEYVSGKTSYEVAELYGVSNVTILELTKEAGVTRGSEFRAKRDEKIVELYKEGVLPNKIAKMFGVDRGVVFKAVGRVITHPPQKRLTDEQRQEIIQAYVSGMSSAKIKRLYDVSQSVVMDIVTAVGLNRAKTLPTEDQKKSITLAYKNNQSISELAAEFGFSTPTIAKVCREAGLTIRSYHKITEDQREQIIALRQKGISSYVVGFQFNISSTHVLRIEKNASERAKREGELTDEQRVLVAKSYEQRGRARRGVGCYNWKGGRRELRKLIRALPHYNEWRKAVFVRDKFTCQICAAAGTESRLRLEADHIYPFTRILDDHKITQPEHAVQCSELWSISNGRTLCTDCHKKTETYGVKALTATI